MLDQELGTIIADAVAKGVRLGMEQYYGAKAADGAKPTEAPSPNATLEEVSGAVDGAKLTKAPSPNATLEEVQAVVKAKIDEDLDKSKGYKAAVKGVLASYKATSLSSLKADDRDAFINAIGQIKE